MQGSLDVPASVKQGQLSWPGQGGRSAVDPTYVDRQHAILPVLEPQVYHMAVAVCVSDTATGTAKVQSGPGGK
jgi:hypothetical protein